MQALNIAFSDLDLPAASAGDVRLPRAKQNLADPLPPHVAIGRLVTASQLVRKPGSLAALECAITCASVATAVFLFFHA